MNNFWSRIWSIVITVPFLIAVSALTVGAAMGISWTKSQVTPVVFVKYDFLYNDFRTEEFPSIYASRGWRASEVTPTVLVKYDSLYNVFRTDTD